MYHHQSTMKIGTDAVLLGIWSDVADAKQILDVGTGSGILALLLSSRNKIATVDAVEIDSDSCREAELNFNNSPFAGRLHIIKQDFNKFAAETRKKYDLVISNPPFFVNDMKSSRDKKRLARHTDSLTYKQLIQGVTSVLSKTGKFCLVLPYSQKQFFLKTCADYGFHLQKEMIIFPKPCKEPNRINMQLGFEKKLLITRKFVIRNENGSFTSDYLNTESDYYISVK